MPEGGPPTAAIQIQLSAIDPAGMARGGAPVAAQLETTPGVIDISDGLPPPGVDWEIQGRSLVRRATPSAPSAVGTVVQLVTTV